MGWRPGVAPLGYFNRAFAGVKDIVVDPERGPLVTEMFNKVVNEGASGRKIKEWLVENNFTNRSGKPVSLSQIFLMLKRPFYYGEFEYPEGNGKWYKGAHEPLITKELFEKARKQLVAPAKSKWGAKFFVYKGIFKCASCKSTVVAEERFRKRLNKPPRRHVYYHCSRHKNYNCQERYISEEKLEKQMLRFLNFMYIAHIDKFDLPENVVEGMRHYKRMRDDILLRQDIDPDSKPWDIREYAKHVFYDGEPKQKRALFTLFDYQLYIQNRMVTTLRAH